MNLLGRIVADMTSAMKAKDKVRLGTLRLMYTAIVTQSKNDNLESTDEVVISILTKERKKRLDTADVYVKAGSQDKADAELGEVAIIAEFLPSTLSVEDTQALVDDIFIANPDYQIRDMGRIINAVQEQVSAKGKLLDKSLVSKIIKLKF